MKKSFFIVAGEPSGDVHAAAIVTALKNINEKITFKGIAGPAMRQEGVEALLPMEELSVMGFTDVLKNLPTLVKAFKRTVEAIRRQKPDMVILVDYQEFNMLLARTLRRRGYKGKIVQYIGPSVWAWRPNRAKTLERYVDLLLTIFPFEIQHYNTKAIKVAYIGNPVAEAAATHSSNSMWRQQHGIAENAPLIALFPGSRRSEVLLNLPIQLEAATLLKKQIPNMRIAISAANDKALTIIASQGNDYLIVPQREKYDLMKESTVALATSGTVTLELAVTECPSVVTYKLGSLNRLIGKHIFKINLPHFCIVNILAQHEIFPELIATTPTASAAAEKLFTLATDPAARRACQSSCSQLHQELIAETPSPQNNAAIAMMRLFDG